ncbi:MAG: translation initiation factor IF-3 [Actinobacteria bacterium]|nr:translation initiation factor IF-3 [Thermoleophilia bacterium]MCX6410370.1 translation initiation factor IF-3 [Actinomycetota bacterium]
MPPRRGPDTRPPAGPSTRINEAIRVELVRLIDDEGENRGEMRTQDALDIAIELNLDLVEVAPEGRPPVCRIMDYGKWRYEQEQKAKQARKHQSTITIKEIKFRPKIDPHDYATKKGHVLRFLKNRDKVKVTIMFRGRELMHPERGEAILLKLAGEVEDLALIESRPNLDGRNMIMMLAPLKALTDKPDAPVTETAAPAADVPESAPAPVADVPAPAPPAEESTSENAASA